MDSSVWRLAPSTLVNPPLVVYVLLIIHSDQRTVTPNPQLTFFDNVKDTLSSPLFAVTLKHKQPGTYDFGFIDDTKHSGQLTYADVDSSEGFWSFSASSYKVGNGAASDTTVSGIAGTYPLPCKVVARKDSL
jgi:aspergillopepsin I